MIFTKKIFNDVINITSAYYNKEHIEEACNNIEEQHRPEEILLLNNVSKSFINGFLKSKMKRYIGLNINTALMLVNTLKRDLNKCKTHQEKVVDQLSNAIIDQTILFIKEEIKDNGNTTN